MLQIFTSENIFTLENFFDFFWSPEGETFVFEFVR